MSSFKIFSHIRFYLCNALCVSSPAGCGKQEWQSPAPSGAYFPLVLEQSATVGEGRKGGIHAGRIRFPMTDERPTHVCGGAKMEKIK